MATDDRPSSDTMRPSDPLEQRRDGTAILVPAAVTMMTIDDDLSVRGGGRRMMRRNNVHCPTACEEGGGGRRMMTPTRRRRSLSRRQRQEIRRNNNRGLVMKVVDGAGSYMDTGVARGVGGRPGGQDNASAAAFLHKDDN